MPDSLKNIQLALFQPDMPQNVGAAMRLCACLGVTLHVIAPVGFIWKEEAFRRTGLDYIDHVTLRRHDSWALFMEETTSRKKILLTTKANTKYTQMRFEEGDVLLLGRESAGVPDYVHRAVDKRIVIPMHGGSRSLNVINAGALVLGEALRQAGYFDD